MNGAGWVLSVLGWAMFAASLGATLDGLPRQLMANFRTRSASKAMRKFAMWGIAAYGLRLAYTLAVGDYLVALAAVPGVAGMAVLLWQVSRYPSRPAHRQWMVEIAGRGVTDIRQPGNSLVVESAADVPPKYFVQDSQGFLLTVHDEDLFPPS